MFNPPVQDRTPVHELSVNIWLTKGPFRVEIDIKMTLVPVFI